MYLVLLITPLAVGSFLKLRTVHDINNAHEKIVNRYYFKRLGWTTSNLGSILFKNTPESTWEQEDKIFVVHIYRYWQDFENRHLTDHETNLYDPLKDCPVKNCEFTRNRDSFYGADAVIVYLFKGRVPRDKRNPNQRWIFLSEESPVNTFAGNKLKPSFYHLADKFNWSMTYRSDSDIPVPYGRTVALTKPVFPNTRKMTTADVASLVPYWNRKRRDVLISILMSSCRTHRMNFFKYLRGFITIDFYGACSNVYEYRKRCPGYFNADCNVTTNYLFYLVLENTSCRQYLTEKIFYNAYLKGAIPIIRHPSVEDCEKLLPPNSFLHFNQFKSTEQLVQVIKAMSRDDEFLLSFHVWRNHFNVTNEHGYFNSKSYYMCRVCQALNYNDKSVKSYDEDDIRLYLDPKLLCTNIPNKIGSHKRRKYPRKRV